MKNFIQLHSFLFLLASAAVALPTAEYDDRAPEPKAQAALFGLKLGGMSVPKLSGGSRGSPIVKSPSKPISKPASNQKIDYKKNTTATPSPSTSRMKNGETKNKSQKYPSPSPPSTKGNKPGDKKEPDVPFKDDASDGGRSRSAKDKYNSKSKSSVDQGKDKSSPTKPNSKNGNDDTQGKNPVSGKREKGKTNDPGKGEGLDKRPRKGRTTKDIDGKNVAGKGNDKDVDDLERVDVRDKANRMIPENGGRDQDFTNGRNRGFGNQNPSMNQDFGGPGQFGGPSNDFNNMDQFGGGFNNRFGNPHRNSLFAAPGPLFNSPGDLLQIVPTVGQLLSRPNHPPMENNLSFNSPANPGSGGFDFNNQPPNNPNNFASPVSDNNSQAPNPDNSRPVDLGSNEAEISPMSGSRLRSIPSGPTSHQSPAKFPENSDSEEQNDSPSDDSPSDAPSSQLDQQRSSPRSLNVDSGSLGLMRDDDADGNVRSHSPGSFSNVEDDDDRSGKEEGRSWSNRSTVDDTLNHGPLPSTPTMLNDEDPSSD